MNRVEDSPANGSDLGLGTTADPVYRTMLRRFRWRFTDLVRELGWDEIGTRQVVCELGAQGMLASSADVGGAIRAIEPCLALSSLAARRLMGSEGGEVPQAGAVERFVSWHERASDWAGRSPLVGGLDEVAVVVERLAAEAVSDVVMLVPSYVPGSYEFSTQIAEAVLRRGARLTAVWCDDFTTSPAVEPHARWLGARGCVPRTATVVPVRAVIVDGTVAVLVDPSHHATVTREAATVEQLDRLASTLWTRGAPVCEAIARTVNDTSRPQGRQRPEIVLRLLADGLTDDAVAGRIGVSVRTVRSDVASAMAGMEARSRFQAGVRAAQLGLL